MTVLFIVTSLSLAKVKWMKVVVESIYSGERFAGKSTLVLLSRYYRGHPMEGLLQ